MADQVGKCNINNTLLLQNAFSVNAVKKEECQEDVFVEDEVQISETAIIPELQDNLICENIKQYNISTTLNNIQTELSSPEVQYNTIHGNLKIEEINVDDMKIEFNNGLSYYEDCRVYCEDYYDECGMLVHILNKTVSVNADNVLREELPNDILEIRDYCGEHGVFALKDIPVGVKFGPFTGLDRTELPWKTKGGKFVVSKDKENYLNWMQYINAARNNSEQNLLVCQYEHNVYYQSTRQIQEGEELLVYFGDECKNSLNRSVEMDFIPTSEDTFKDTFACTFCCFGFSSKLYLAKHKAICPENADGGFSLEELMQCPTCKIHLEQKEYISHHMAYCYERNNRKCVLPTPGKLAARITRHAAGSRQMYKCQQCNYSTKYKGDLKNHTNQHYKVKTYKCEICCQRYKTKEVLRLHVENTHIRSDGKDDLAHSSAVYVKVHVKAEHSRSQDEVKQMKCVLCEFRTKYKRILKRHMKTKHLKEFKYKCEMCNYKTYQKSNLKVHVESRHLKQLKYKCDLCEYKANLKHHLQRHIEARHLKEFKYKCDLCDYKAGQKYQLQMHVKTKHLNEFKYKCDTCEYKANFEYSLKRHINTRHLKIFKYNCDKCEYKVNLKHRLERHIERIHLKFETL